MNLMLFYSIIFFATALISFGLTIIFREIALKIGAIDKPNERKIHKKPVARLGGVAIFISLFIVVFSVLPVDKHILGVFIGSSILLLFGIIDDVIGMNAWVKLFGQILAAFVVIVSGVGISFIANPFGGYIHLDSVQYPISLFGITYHFVLWADLFTLFWIVLVINAVNFLDGVDGLASGVSGISAIVIFFLSISSVVSQPDTGLLALILAGASLGFLPLNFNPAKIFMGDSGSMFLGFILAILAIISGGKIATALLILGLPIIDLVWAVIRRVVSGGSPFKPDKKHLHHELLGIGLSQRQTVLIIYFMTIVLGVFALWAKSFYKMMGIAGLVLFVVLGISYFSAKKSPRIN